jgi:hypothetical protein
MDWPDLGQNYIETYKPDPVFYFSDPTQLSGLTQLNQHNTATHFSSPSRIKNSRLIYGLELGLTKCKGPKATY